MGRWRGRAPVGRGTGEVPPCLKAGVSAATKFDEGEGRLVRRWTVNVAGCRVAARRGSGPGGDLPDGVGEGAVALDRRPRAPEGPGPGPPRRGMSGRLPEVSEVFQGHGVEGPLHRPQ